jgi:hypothetical protein
MIKVKIANSLNNNVLVERQAFIDWKSILITENLTSSADSLKFLIKKYGGKNYAPLLGEEVIFEVDNIKVFGGYIVNIEQNGEALSNSLKITVKDYTHILDRKLVSKTYENLSASAIISDLVSSFAPAGFTTNNVVAPIIIKKIVFNYLSISNALEKLCKMLGIYDWYVDANKDIHFFESGENPAPFEINDGGGNFAYSSLDIKRNATQIKNKIIIRGGTVEGDTFTDKKIADGQQKTFFIGYSLTTISALKNATALTIGIDGKDRPDNFDVLYNSDNGFLIFRDDNKPAINDVITYSGKPTYPLITQKSDLTSQEKYGVCEFVIVDKSIKSKASASQRADAELIQYSVPQSTINFRTTTGGLKTGHYIRVNSVGHNILDEHFKIATINRKMRTPESFYYEVEGVLSENITLVNLLKKMLVDSQSDKVDISNNEVIDRLFSADEKITFNESYTVSKLHNPIIENVSIGESYTWGKNLGTKFVYGNYKSNLVLDGDFEENFPNIDLELPDYAFAYFVNNRKDGILTQAEIDAYFSVGYPLWNFYSYRTGNFKNRVARIIDNNKKVFKLTLNGGYVETRYITQGYFGASGIKLKPNTTYNFKVRDKVQNVSGSSANGFNVQLLFSNAGGGGVSDVSLTGGGKLSNQDWTEYTGSFTTGATVEWGHPEIRAYGHNGAGTLAGEYLVDYIYITEAGINDIKRNAVFDGSPVE